MENFTNSRASQYLEKAQKIFNENDAQEALGTLAAGFSADVSYKPLYELALRCLQQLGAEDEAEFYENALADFNNPDVFYDLGYFYVDVGHNGLAVPFLERARQLAPNDSQIAVELSLAYIAVFQPQRARDILSGFELNRFWDLLLYHKCSLLCGEPKGIREFVDLAKEDLPDVPFDTARMLQAINELDESLRRLSTLGQPQAVVRDWHFIQYGAAILDYFDERITPEASSVAGGRYVYQAGSNSHIAGILWKLKRYLNELNRCPSFIFGLPDRDSEIIGRAAAEILDLPFFAAGEEDASHPYCLAVAADNRLIGFPTPLETIYDHHILFALNLNWLSSASVTPDVVGLMSQDYILPWKGGAMQIDENGKMKMTPSDDRPAELIAQEIASAEPEQDSGFAETLDFYKSRADLLKGGENGGDRRLLFRVDSPVPGAFFS